MATLVRPFGTIEPPPRREDAKAVKLEMRRNLARESFEEKIRKVAQLIQLSRTFPKAERGPVFAKDPNEFVEKAGKFFKANVK